MNISAESSLMVGGLLNAVGAALKASPRIPNTSIPFMLAVLGGAGYSAMEGWTGPNFVLGVAVALGAVGAHQVVTQSKTIAAKEKDDSTPPPNPPTTPPEVK